MQVCIHCKATKPLSDFYKHPGTSNGHAGVCKECHHLRCKHYYQKNKHHLREKQRNANLKKNFGISLDEWLTLFKQQGSKCAICGKFAENLSVKNKWHTDHDHQTGKVRGILCHHCNTALGNFFDNPVVLQRAIDYLKGITTNG